MVPVQTNENSSPGLAFAKKVFRLACLLPGFVNHINMCSTVSPSGPACELPLPPLWWCHILLNCFSQLVRSFKNLKPPGKWIKERPYLQFLMSCQQFYRHLSGMLKPDLPGMEIPLSSVLCGPLIMGTWDFHQWSRFISGLAPSLLEWG